MWSLVSLPLPFPNANFAIVKWDWTKSEVKSLNANISPPVPLGCTCKKAVRSYLYIDISERFGPIQTQQIHISLFPRGKSVRLLLICYHMLVCIVKCLKNKKKRISFLHVGRDWVRRPGWACTTERYIEEGPWNDWLLKCDNVQYLIRWLAYENWNALFAIQHVPAAPVE
jgi:hypothetical protein